jgi:aerobic C4-dicarboxylate transport protein
MKLTHSLYFQVIVGIVLGVAVGAIWPKFAAELGPIGDGFVRLIKMVIGPVVFCTVAGGIAHMGDLKRFGRVGLKALIYFEAVSTLALVLGLVVGTVLGPGRGFPVGEFTVNKTVSEYIQKGQGQSVTDYLLHLIPDTFVSPFTTGDLLPIVLLAILTGFALTMMGERGKEGAEFLDKVSAVMFGIIRIVVRIAPIGAFGAMAFTIGKFGTSSLVQLAALVGTFYITSICFVLVVLGVIARFAGFSILKFLRYIREELLVVLGTSSSESVLPQLMTKLTTLGVAKPVVGVVVPTGYSFNLDGTNIYMTLATLFLAQATHTPLSLGQILGILLITMLTSKGASGVTGAGFITLAATLQAIPAIPIASLMLIFGVDRFMSECRSLTNTVGNGVASIVVAKWDGSLDVAELQRQLG